MLRSGNGALVGTYLKDHAAKAEGVGEEHATCCPICQVSRALDASEEKCCVLSPAYECASYRWHARVGAP
jgi:hypothetical protein